MSQYLEIGSLGWQHEGWLNEAFYPEELPEDWQLTYYSNEFRFIVIPASQWQEASAGEMGQWLEDVHDRFRFFIELTHESITQSHEKINQLADVIKDRLLGFIYRMGDTLSDQDLDVLVSLKEVTLVYVDKEKLFNPAELEIFRQRGFRPCWRPGKKCIEEVPVVGLLQPAAELEDLRALRTQIQDFLGTVSKEGDFFLVFEGVPPSAKAMRDAVVIADLLGV